MRKFDFNYGEQNVFDMFFIGIVSMAHCHPGAGIWRNDQGKYVTIDKPSLEDCAQLALDMIEVRRQMRGE
jgi:hypothetical protein